MAEFEVLCQHTFRDQKGFPLPKSVGERVFVDNRHVSKQLIEQGIIGPIGSQNFVQAVQQLSPKPRAWVGTRVALVIHTSTYYSGGRVHLFQYAWSLARAGADVLYVSDRVPVWAKDYPSAGIKFVTVQSAKELPCDIDLLITDGKDRVSAIALDYRKTHPRSKMVVMNFETPNWMQGFDANTAKRMQETKKALAIADLWACNSEESEKYLREYMGSIQKPCVILPPAVNDSAIGLCDNNPVHVMDSKTPYIAWSSRNSKYKCNAHAMAAAFSYPNPLNIVCIGQPQNTVKDSHGHRSLSFERPITDAEKMAVFTEAACVVAPSLFEGFGMVPSEALSCGTPIVVYDLPVLRQNYGDKLVYAKWNDPEDFKKKVHQVVDYRLNKTPVEIETHKLEPDAEEAKATYGLAKMEEQVKGFPYHYTKGKTSITANIICYYGPTIQEAIASVYPYVDEVMIAHGPVTLWKDVPPDNSLDLIQAFPDPDKKIKLEARKEWTDKGQMRTWCGDNSSGNRMLIVDADEIYYGLEDWIKYDAIAACPKWVHFWHNQDHYVIDDKNLRWGTPHEAGIPGTIYNHFRWSHWRNGYKFHSTKGTTGRAPDNKPIGDQAQTVRAVNACPNTVIYHLGHVLTPELMQAKHLFYRKRDGDNAGRQMRQRAWHNWNGSIGPCGDGIVKKVDWELPPLVVQAFDKIGLSNANA